jgi:vitamin B12 transporter
MKRRTDGARETAHEMSRMKRRMKRRIARATALLATAVLMRNAQAQEQEHERADVAEDEVMVRGSRAGGFEARARLDDAPREVTDAASLVDPLPGVHVRRFGGDDSFATLSIRGSSSSEVAIYLAGVPLTGGADPTLDLATLPLWPGARARVYRSFAPAAMGPGSLGGTLALDPPAAASAERSDVWAATGAFGARRIRAGDVRALGDGPDAARVVTALSASRSDDDYSYYDRTLDAFTTRENAGHAQVGGLVAWSVPVRLTDGAMGRVTVTTLAQARRQQLAGNVWQPTPNQRLESDRELAAIELSVPGGRGAWVTRAWARRDGLRLSDRPTEQSPGPAHTDDRIVGAGGAAGWRGRLGDGLRLDARLDGSGERFAPGAWGDATPPPGATRASVGLASDLEWDATRALTATASARLDTWHDGGGDASSARARDEVRPTGHLGAELRAGPVAIAAHGGALTRAPSFLERYGNRGAFVGDPALAPESAWTVDLGARTAARAGALSVRAELVGFASWAEDLIAFVPTSFGAAKAKNIGRARIAGVEAELGARALGAEIRASYTGLATANESECQLSAGPLPSTGGADACPSRPPLPGRPAHDVVVDVTYELGPLRVR